ncbi:MAG: methylmalonyl-CoA mutase family protein [Spirochaetota bacterium]|nr:methylmalonyl-CoA mutase family protein [Spirochaetota bacterium]
MERVKERKRSRDQSKVKAALADLHNAAMDEDINLFEAVINATKSRVSSAEILEKLRKALGRDNIPTTL